jgi:hypothetical protein
MGANMETKERKGWLALCDISAPLSRRVSTKEVYEVQWRVKKLVKAVQIVNTVIFWILVNYKGTALLHQCSSK